MRLLLDTHALLWWHADDPRLPDSARQLIQAPGTQVLVSAASAWEIATKARIGKLHGVHRLLAEFDGLIEADQFTHLPIRHDHARLAGSFDDAHRDPFDRMLAAQSLIEDAVLLSNDIALQGFGGRIAW